MIVNSFTNGLQAAILCLTAGEGRHRVLVQESGHMDGLEQRIEKAVRGQAQPTVTILSSLLAVEDELHYIPREAVDWVARYIGATVNDVWAVASFYPNFRFEPPAQRQVEVCWGASCHLMGAMRVVDAVLEAAGLETEGERPDHRLAVRLNTCLGACAQAPVMSFDHHLVGRVSPESAAERVSEILQAKSPAIQEHG